MVQFSVTILIHVCTACTISSSPWSVRGPMLLADPSENDSTFTIWLKLTCWNNSGRHRWAGATHTFCELISHLNRAFARLSVPRGRSLMSSERKNGRKHADLLFWFPAYARTVQAGSNQHFISAHPRSVFLSSARARSALVPWQPGHACPRSNVATHGRSENRIRVR